MSSINVLINNASISIVKGFHSAALARVAFQIHVRHRWVCIYREQHYMNLALVRAVK